MIKKTIVRENMYYDSVTLMSLSSKVIALEGVEEAVVSMASAMNKELLANIGLDTEESEAAKASDLLIAVLAANDAACERALATIDEMLEKKSGGRSKGRVTAPKNIPAAMEQLEGSNLALISVPGAYAVREARIALEKGLHVMLFSDNVALDDERRLKELGREKGLLVMGPDCGTAFLNGTGLCFANSVRRGGIGLVAASGTGLQEVMVQIHRLGGGVSQAIGTGGRDLKEEIGGIMMLEGLQALARDEQTKVIVLISKPPAASVREKILDAVDAVDKPVVICFLDDGATEAQGEGVLFAQTLYDAAKTAVETSGLVPAKDPHGIEAQAELIEEQNKALEGKDLALRGLFGGGTLCAEALGLLRGTLGPIKSNISKRTEEQLDSLDTYSGHVLLDLGEDEFTNGRPHPMIEPTPRLEKIVSEAKDPGVGVILLDFVLGFGAHEDPVGVTIPAIEQAKEIAAKENRPLVFVGYICGTDLDEQAYEKQRNLLVDAGVIVAGSNVEATQIVKRVMGKEA